MGLAAQLDGKAAVIAMIDDQANNIASVDVVVTTAS